MVMGQRWKCLLLIVVMALSGVHGVRDRTLYGVDGLSDNYYRYSCPNAESVIQTAVNTELDKNLKLAAGIIRMQFHDCFVEGCDGSVLLDGSNTEKQAPINAKLIGYEVIDAAKAAVEAVCPGVVSCADIIAYAARDSTVKLSGSRWEVQGGRKDGFHSSASEAEADLPPPEFGASQLIDSFARRELSTAQMVILSGSHTVGVADCSKIVGRLYNFNNNQMTDPSMDPAYAEQLKKDCPQNSWNTTIEVFMDTITPGSFDSNYYQVLQQRKGLFTSDQTLLNDARTSGTVNTLMENGRFQKEFGEAMRAMAAIGVKSGSQGEIRKYCRSVNY
ncbi:hypothetical protein R1sor_011916 [Riccia sorocarpa]|uniref:Peroxidase n=1 Tax=Riccia sorocarpa TaxID=122646 RepID=A0ABD3I5X7_9MARC